MSIEEKAHVKHSKNIFKKIPWYGWVGAIVFIFFQIALYKLACYFSQKVGNHYSLCPKTAIDDHIAFCPYFFIEIYFLAYGFWFITPLWISTSKNKQNFINFMVYSTIASFIGFFWMIAMPTYMNRVSEGLVGPGGVGFGPLVENIKSPLAKFLVESIIKMDTGEIGWNMCPSYHCMASALCAFAVLRRKEHKLPTQIGFGVMAILVFCATVLVKQHYFVDILGGVAVALIPYLIVILVWHPGEKIMLNNPLFLQAKHLTKKDVVKAKEAKDTTKSEREEKLEKEVG